jgi:cytochrome c oxidase assembly protein subunit 15
MSRATYRRLSTITLVGTVLVILWGAFVRATGSGAGCGSHWPLCNGEVVPRSPTAATLVELTHRLTSGVLGVLVLALVFAAFRTFPRRHPARATSLVTLFFLVTEALIGAGLVLLELVADNKSLARGWWMAAHLVNTFVLLAVTTLMTWYGWSDAPPRVRGPAAGRLGGGLVLLLAVGVTGAIAALGDTLFPASSLAAGFAMDTAPGAHLLLRLRVLHPFLAGAAAAYLLWIAGTLMSKAPSPTARRIASWVGGLVLAQIVIGFANLALLAPVGMQILHLLLADAVWIATVLLGASVTGGPALTAGRAVPATAS